MEFIRGAEPHDEFHPAEPRCLMNMGSVSGTREPVGRSRGSEGEAPQLGGHRASAV